MPKYYQPTIEQLTERIKELYKERIELTNRFVENHPLCDLIRTHIDTEIAALNIIINRNSIP